MSSYNFVAMPDQFSMSRDLYAKACIPGNCKACGKPAGSREKKEAFIWMREGCWEVISTKTSRLCLSCYHKEAAQEQKRNAKPLQNLKKLYVEIIKRDGGGNDYREGWGEE